MFSGGGWIIFLETLFYANLFQTRKIERRIERNFNIKEVPGYNLIIELPDKH